MRLADMAHGALVRICSGRDTDTPNLDMFKLAVIVRVSNPRMGRAGRVARTVPEPKACVHVYSGAGRCWTRTLQRVPPEHLRYIDDPRTESFVGKHGRVLREAMESLRYDGETYYCRRSWSGCSWVGTEPYRGGPLHSPVCPTCRPRRTPVRLRGCHRNGNRILGTAEPFVAKVPVIPPFSNGAFDVVMEVALATLPAAIERLALAVAP